ncbi:MAG: class I adenylate cyclase [Nitrospinota bacterium]|nr:class I adenylate cyclase [Nitrospinota bacterium]
MHDAKTKISNTLFNNRQLFLRYNQYKINRILETLSPNDRLVFTLIPRLLHINQEGLPGYIEDNVPAGIYNFEINQECRMAAEKLFPEIILRGGENHSPFIRTVLLMGSTGSIAQSKKSDLDFTLFVDKNSVSAERLELFDKKLKLIEEWTWDRFQIEIHFFNNDTLDVRNNIFGESDSESTGSAQAKLLKEEMYRTAVIMGGKIPFWWIVPLHTDDRMYEKLYELVRSNQTLLNPDDFLDTGNVDDISQGEFFGGSIWTLIKSFRAPFKTLIKMGLLEEYMFNKTQSNLLCHEIKKKVFSGIPYEKIDTYKNLFERVEKYFFTTKTEREVDALRTAFYLKTGSKVNSYELIHGSKDPNKKMIIELINDWDWDPEKVEKLNSYLDWQMMEKVALGNEMNQILMNSYKKISEANSKLGTGHSLITEKDTHLLGRKLFSFYRKTVNKVENLFALVDGDTSEKELTFYLHQTNPRAKGTWYLIRGKTLALLELIPQENIIKKASTLQFLIAFTCFNSLYNSSTSLLLRAEQQSIKDQDLNTLLRDLSSFLAQVNIAEISNSDLLANAYIKQVFTIVDFGNPIPREITIGNIKDCTTQKEYSNYLTRRLERIRSAVTIYLTSWGELFCKTYSGINCMGRALKDLRPQIADHELDNPSFLKVFVPGSRRDTMNLYWLNTYIMSYLKSSTTTEESPHAEK